MIGKRIFTLSLFMLTSLVMHGQDLPSLPADPGITKGKLPNGIEYYLVSNKTDKGRANYSLVQTGRSGLTDARKALCNLPHFPGRKPYEFLADNGIACSSTGYVVEREDASVFSFCDVPVYNQSAADSTLLMIFDLAAASRAPQAVVISGDIDKDKIKERMGLLSMMVPALEKHSFEDGYVWNPKEDVSYRMTLNRSRDVASINVIFSAQRTGRDLLNTALPLVTSGYASNLGHIVEVRLKRALKLAGIPVPEIRYRYVDAAGSPGDEYYSFTIFTSMEHLDAATSQVASVLGSLDKYGATYEELVDAKDYAVIGDPDNNGYTEKCISSYLYGSNLASASVLRSYLVNRAIPDQGELELFNGFASALLDSARSLTLRYDVPSRVDAESVIGNFNSSWGTAGRDRGSLTKIHLSALPSPSGKVKLRSEAAEPISGGKLWTFSNGVKVIYKKTSSDGMFHYAVLLRGGLSDVPGLKPGEGAFVGDMLPLGRVARIEGSEFQNALKAEGITMESQVSLSDMRLTGTSPKPGFPLLMKALYAMSHDRQPDNEAFDYYRMNEALKIDMESLGARNVNAIMDSVICPDYKFTMRKNMASLGADLNLRAESYFAAQFSKFSDGVVVFFGDLDEETLKKELCKSLGAFQVEKKIAQRPKVTPKWATGSKTINADSVPGSIGGSERGAYVALSADIPFSLNNYMSFLVAEMALKKTLAGAMSRAGAWFEVSHKEEVFPSERITLYINSRPCRASGLPEEVSVAEPQEILSALRSVTGTLGSLNVDAVDLKAYKAALLSRLDAERSNPDKLIESVLIRYSEGKDIVTGYKAAVESVSRESVGRVLEMLGKGAEVEYVID